MSDSVQDIRTALAAMRGYPLRIFLICLFGLTLSNTDQSLFSYAIPGLLSEFELGLDAVGWILSISFVLSVIVTLGLEKIASGASLDEIAAVS